MFRVQHNSLIKSAVYYGGTFAAMSCLSAALFSGRWLPVAGLIAAIACVGCIHFLSSTEVQPDFHRSIVFWVIACPLGYSLVQIPPTSTVLTLDRLFGAGALLVLAGAAIRTRRLPIPVQLRKATLAWMGFILVVIYSLRGVHGKEFVASMRMLCEVFVVPGVIALYILQQFNAARHLRSLHLAICIVTIYLAFIGIAEVKTGIDLLPTAAERNEYYAGSGDVRLLRANGPYGTNGTYATVGLLNLLFLEFVRKNIPDEIRGWRKSMHWTAIACACIVALLPMFRALVITATVIGSAALYQKHGKKAVVRILGLVTLVVLLGLTLKVLSPSLFEERVSDPSNFNARLAEYKQCLSLFSDHPLVGVGLSQFYNSVADRYRYLFYFKGESSLDAPHNFALALLAETGALGVLFFATAQVMMLIGFRGLLSYGRTKPSGAWNFVVLMFLTYCGMNVDLVSGYYDELNIWYLFVLALVVKYGVQQTHQLTPRQIRRHQNRRPVHAV